MRFRRIATASAGLALAAGLIAPMSASAAGTSSASGTSSTAGTRSLATVLLADGDTFDTNWYDYDIVTQAALAVLDAKPSSPVAVLTDGRVALTAFIPSDDGFRRLVRDLGGAVGTEKQVFDAVAALGIDTVETVLLYHVVPGATITAAQAARADGARLVTALGTGIHVDVKYPHVPLIRLFDKDPDDANPWINPWAVNINKGNKQIAHGITHVLRPVNL